MTWKNGRARNPHSPDPNLWFIVDENDQKLAEFDHSKFGVLNGTPVKYLDENDDGWAENVQPAAVMLRYVERAGFDGDEPDEVIGPFHALIGAALLNVAAATGTDRGNALRRLRRKIDQLKATAGAE